MQCASKAVACIATCLFSTHSHFVASWSPNNYNSTMPSAAEVRSLFRHYLRIGKHFPNYNIKHYITRRAKEEFHSLASNKDAAAAEAAWQRAKSELEVWKRQSVVYQLYGRRIKNVMELGGTQQH